MNTVTFYHGSSNEITNFRSSVIYFSTSKEDAMQYAQMNGSEGFIYCTEVAIDMIEEEEDFDCLDCGGYQNPDCWALPVVLHKESGYAFAKDASSLIWNRV